MKHMIETRHTRTSGGINGPSLVHAPVRTLLVGAALCASPCLADAKGLAALLVGEYDNNEQVWQQGIDGDAPDPRRHWRFRRHGENGLDLSIGLGQTSPEAAGWTIALLDDPKGRIATEFLGTARCRYMWRAKDVGYAARTTGGDCPGLPTALAIDAEWLTSTWSTPEGERAERARRVRHYTGWVALRRSRLDPAAAPDDYVFVSEARWHDEGFVLPVLDGDRPTGYAVELARLTYQNTRAAVLKLGVIDAATGETLSYSWAAPGADRIGINLRWIQAGLTRDSQGEGSADPRP